MYILITGGAGYIGTHTLIELNKCGYSFIVYDNLSNSNIEAIRRVEKIINKPIKFIEGDTRDSKKLNEVFSTYNINSVIHFAGLKAVGESLEKPLDYYDNNVVGTLRLLENMKKYNCKNILFSSSATVYGNPISNPIDENFPVGATTNPYGTSKYIIERILEDLYISDKSFKIVILRYFNPVGAYESGTIGEDPNGIPNNLMPAISQTAIGKKEYVNVFGNDYDTHDGTGVRDYIHVVDLANAHAKAIDYINDKNSNKNLLKLNLGTGIGYSVLDIIKTFEKVSNKKVHYKLINRRVGDVSTCYANPKKAYEILGWKANKTLEDMCADTWKWQQNNPYGYKEK